jgi:hypothetical protein
VADTARVVLVYGVLPLWIASGLADWACHRRTGIARTSGLPENLFHWVLFAQMGLPVAAVLLLEVNAAVLALVVAGFLLHEATVYLELRYAVPRREVRPAEQMVHSLMEVLPLALLGVLVVGYGVAPGGLQWKAQPWPVGEVLGLAIAVFLCNVLPLAEESWRCAKRMSLRT